MPQAQEIDFNAFARDFALRALGDPAGAVADWRAATAGMTADLRSALGRVVNARLDARARSALRGSPGGLALVDLPPGSSAVAEFTFRDTVRLGARGLVLKGDSPDKLFAAIRTVANGELAFADEVAQGIITAMADEPQQQQPSNMNRLSEREKQIAYLVARGLKNRDIAAQLAISENTVKRHLQSIFSKTGARDRLELAVLALSDITNAA